MSFKLFENIGLGEFDLSILIIIMLIMIIIGWIIAIIALIKYQNLNKKYQKFMGGNEAKALEK